MFELGRRHRSILKQIFERPRRADVSWRDVEVLLKVLGATFSQGRGSRVRVLLNGVRAVLHRPHPRKELDKGMLASVERYLRNAGVEPEDPDAYS